MVLMGRARHIGLFAQPGRTDVAAALAALQRVGMARKAYQPFNQLSGGERQMVVIGRALVSEAQVLILDEPSSTLDLRNQFLILSWLRQLSKREGLTVIFTTHHPHHALAIADVALLMLGGDRFELGTAAEVLTESRLSALYGVPLKRLTFVHDGQSFETVVPALGPQDVSMVAEQSDGGPQSKPRRREVSQLLHPPVIAVPAEFVPVTTTSDVIPPDRAIAEPPSPQPEAEKKRPVMPADYVASLAQRLASVKHYPALARQAREQGTVTLSFELERSGRLLSWHIDRGSGFVALDEEVRRIVVSAAPFPPFPKVMDKPSETFVVPIEFPLDHNGS